jgi:divalent metal cation (Fe/Co/Zn/Cd) transporter
MIITFAVLISVFIFFTIVRTLRNRSWSLIWSSFGYEDYFKMMAKLKSKGISCKVETPYRGISTRSDRYKDNTQYDIYVKKGMEQEAIAALQQNH